MADDSLYTDTLFPGVAVITGAAGTGIGSAIAKAFAIAGCKRIAITDLRHDSLGDTSAWIQQHQADAETLSLAGDISDSTFVETFYRAVNSRFGHIDYSVNVAGIIGSNQPSDETSPEDFDKVNNVNYRGVWLCSREALRYMKTQDPLPSHDPSRAPQRGSIVSIASQLGIVSRPAAPAYNASKAAVISLTKSDAIDYAKHGIRVNCVCPGIVDTPMTNGANSSSEFVEMLQKSIKIAPMERMAQPSEIADAVLFLASTKASFVTGHAMVVDGGYVIN